MLRLPQFPGVMGNQDARSILSRALASGTLSRAVLISGPAGAGKRALALACAEVLLDDSSGRALRGEHPDIVLYDYGDEEFKVGRVRDLRDAAFLTPTEADTRVFILAHAQNLNIQAQNALLKLLEDPPVYFFLLCEQESPLLPTVLSRCLKLTCQPPDEETALAILRERFPDADVPTLKASLAEADGYPETAASLYERSLSEESGHADETARALLDAALRGDELGLWRVVLAENKLTRDDCERILSALSKRILQQMTSDGASRDLARLSEIIARMRTLLEGNVPPAHALGLFAQYFAL